MWHQKSLFKLSKIFETGLPDHHKLISTIIESMVVLKAHQRLLWSFNIEKFYYTIRGNLERMRNKCYKNFQNSFCNALNICAPFQTKIPRWNNNYFEKKKKKIGVNLKHFSNINVKNITDKTKFW